MTRALRTLLCLLLLAAPLGAQRGRRDPLSEAEVDKLRELADQPDKMLKLYVVYAKARMLAIDQIRSDPRFVDDRPQRLHHLLQDLGTLVDEIDDHIDEYLKKKLDVRPALKEVVEADSDFQLKLRTIKEQVAGDPKLGAEANAYKFVLEDTVDSINQSADSSRQALDQQNRDFAKKKKGKDKEDIPFKEPEKPMSEKPPTEGKPPLD